MITSDLTDIIFTNLTVLDQAPKRGNEAHWNVRCKCNKILIVSAGHLKSGHTKSCRHCGHKSKPNVRLNYTPKLTSSVPNNIAENVIIDYKLKPLVLVDGLAKKYKINKKAVKDILANNNLKLKVNDCSDEICKLYLSNMPLWEITNKFKTSSNTILKILEKSNISKKTLSESHRTYQLNEKFFDIIDSEEKAYFLGFLYADGYNFRKTNSVKLELAIKDKEILYKLSKLIYEKIYKDRVIITDRTSSNKGLFAHVSINNKRISEQLERLGCSQNKSFKIRFPTWLNESLHHHFIRGYFDGDGSVTIKNKGASVKITSNENFIDDLRIVLKKNLNLHFSKSSSSSKSNNIKTSTIMNCGNRFVELFLDWIYKDSTIFLKRKHKKYLKLKENIKEIDKKILAGTQGYSKSILLKYKKL